MACLICGDICKCSIEVRAAGSPRWLPDPEAFSSAALGCTGLERAAPECAVAELGLVTNPESVALSEPRFVANPEIAAPTRSAAGVTIEASGLAASERADSAGPVAEGRDQVGSEVSANAPPDSSVWRHEVADRLHRYHARRKPRPPRYPSLRLRFENEESIRNAGGSAAAASGAMAISAVASRHAVAVALDSLTESGDNSTGTGVIDPGWIAEPEATFSTASADAAAAPFGSREPARHFGPSAGQTTAQTTAKIIEFPRSSPALPPPLDELAEPVIARPRILEVAEVAAPPPALGGITIEAATLQAVEKRPGIDVPLQSAPLARRVLAALIDGALVVAAVVLFGFIFWKVAAVPLPKLQIWALAAGLVSLLWAGYQYLLVVYSAATPGLRLARLELARFDGSPAGRGLRRWRVLASFLSAVSIGMGYAWVFLDEDALCWHDRITHTYLAPKRREPAGADGSGSTTRA